MLTIEKFLQKADSLLIGRKLYVVCNIKNREIVSDNFNKFDIRTEYLSDDELEQINVMLNKCLSVERYFYSEFDFINYVILENPAIESIIVYNSAQSGTGIGRKSLMPAFCASRGIKITGSNTYAASLCRHKYHVMKLLEVHGLSVPKTYLYDNGWIYDKPALGKKIIIKPIFESSSIGINEDNILTMNDETAEFVKAKQAEMKQPVIAQQFINGYEAEVPCIALKSKIFTLPPVGICLSENELIMGTKILDYEKVYFDKYSFYNLNQANLNTSQISKSAELAVKILGLSGLCRVDFRIDKNGQFYIIDVSTNPHFINHSSTNFSFKLLSLSSDKIMKAILGAALL